MWDERTVAEKEKIKTKISIKNKGRKLSVEHCEKIKERMTGKKQSDEYIQRRVEGRARGGIPYNTPQQIEKNRESNRKTHTSEEFKQKYKEVYEASRIKISHSMKEKIKNGEFTPPITNSWTRRKAYAINKSIKKNFRSSWEAVFWLSNPNLLFEKTRIPYIFEGKQRIYITDFTDEEKKVIYEIKPDSLRDTEQNIAKFKALSDWCEKNNYTCEIIGNSWFRKNVTRELLKGNKQLIKPMARFLND
jgi:hypothetical protein